MIYLNFHVSSFWLEIAILEAKFDIFGVNRGQMFKIKYFNPKRHILAWLRAFCAITRQNQSKGLISARASEKKVTRKHLAFHYLPRSPPWMDFYKLGTNVPLMDLINCDGGTQQFKQTKRKKNTRKHAFATWLCGDNLLTSWRCHQRGICTANHLACTDN